MATRDRKREISRARNWVFAEANAQTADPPQCAQNRVQLPETGKSAISKEWVVADAVIVEALFTLQFPANREKKYREFCKIAASAAADAVNNTVVPGLLARIPYSTEQGIILSEHGNLA